MFNSISYIRDLCQQKGIAISALEKNCGFSNGYLNPKKQKKVPYERALLIADYLQVPVEEILGLPAQKEKPVGHEADGLDEQLVNQLIQLTPEEERQVDAFVKGLLAARREPPSPDK